MDASKKKSTSSERKVKVASNPPSSRMVIEAVTTLQEPKGSSLQAIKNYIAGHYNFDVERKGRFIRQAILKNIDNGVLVRVGGRGVGVNGSFKLSSTKKEKKPASALLKVKIVAPKKNNKAPAEKKETKTPSITMQAWP